MSYDKEKEKKETFERIGQSIENMWDIIERCNNMLNNIGFNAVEIPNIIISYGNKYLEIAKKFEKVNIDFYAQNCESRYIIENKLQAQILKGKDTLSKFERLLIISKKEIDEKKRQRRILEIEDNYKKGKINEREYIYNISQLIEAKKQLENLRKIDNYIKQFELKEEMIGAILYYRTLALTNGVLDFDDRIEKIDEEFLKLGYSGLKQIYYGELEKQSIGIKTLQNIQSKGLHLYNLLDDYEK